MAQHIPQRGVATAEEMGEAGSRNPRDVKLATPAIPLPTVGHAHPDEIDVHTVNEIVIEAEAIGLQPPQQPGAFSFAVLIRELQKQRKNATERQKVAHKLDRGLGYNCGVGVLTKACEVISEGFPFLRERPIYFFVDDYSSPKISVDLQRNLIPVDDSTMCDLDEEFAVCDL